MRLRKDKLCTMKDHDVRRRLVLLEKWGHQCVVCGRGFANLACVTIEHINPRARGGADADVNRGPSHYVCNRLKRTRSLLWAARQVQLVLKNIERMGNDPSVWLNTIVPGRTPHPHALLTPLDARWFF